MSLLNRARKRSADYFSEYQRTWSSLLMTKWSLIMPFSNVVFDLGRMIERFKSSVKRVMFHGLG